MNKINLSGLLTTLKYIFLIFLSNSLFAEDARLQEYFGNLQPYGQEFFRDFSTAGVRTGVHISDEYVMGIGDELIVNIWGSVEHEYKRRIDSSGQIVIPGIGTIHIDGKTINTAKEIIKQKLLSRYKNINISITTGELRTLDIFILGQVQSPGSYTVSPFTNLVEALTIAGGITENGSMRNIIVNNKQGDKAETYDLYPLIMKGHMPEKRVFSQGDIIFVPSSKFSVGIRGAVRNPGVYEVSLPTTVSRLLELCGGLLPFADKEHTQIERIGHETGKTIINLPYEELTGYEIHNFDLITINSLPAETFYKLFVEGAVKRPGIYGWKEGMRISDVLKRDSLLPYALTDKAELIRTDSTGSREVIIFSPEKILNGDTAADMAVMPRDRILIYSQERPAKLVMIMGQVYYPGEYVIGSGETISSAIERAGGLTNKAFLNGMVFNRERIRLDKENQISDFIRDKETVIREEKEKTVKEAEKVLLEEGMVLLQQMRQMDIKGRVALRIDDLQNFSGSKNDLLLENGDVIIIPEKPVSVAVLGEVSLPSNIVYNEKNNLNNYIEQAGGYTRSADRRNIFIAKPCGTASRNTKDIQPGDTIVVPFIIQERRGVIIRDIVQMFYQLSLGLAAF